MTNKKTEIYTIFLNIAAVGAAWGIFEATAGYLLHSISFGYSWLIWYPIACFFMANAYRKTKKISSIFFVGLLSASIKMLNLLLPGSVDRVINPAVSIVFEVLSMAGIFLIANHFFQTRKSPYVKALMALGMNTGWRLLYIAYLLFLVPDWMREISVISSQAKFISFFVTQNLITSGIVFVGYQFMNTLFKPVLAIERRFSTLGEVVPVRILPLVKVGVVAVMLGANVALELLL